MKVLTEIVLLLSSKLLIKARVDELYMLSFMLPPASKTYKVIRVKTATEMKLNLAGGQLMLCVSRKHPADVGSHQAGVFPTHQMQS